MNQFMQDFMNRNFEQAQAQASSSMSFNNRMPIPKVKVPKKLKMKTGGIIALNEGSDIYQASNLNNFNEKLLNASNLWHMVIVHHNKRVNKMNILHSLNEMAKDNLFAAYVYTEGISYDFFLVYNQDKFLLELVKAGLTLVVELVEANVWIALEIRTRVGNVMPGHPKLGERSLSVIRERIKDAISYGGADVFDLSEFSSLMSSYDIEATLSNSSVISAVFSQINGIEVLKEKFHVFKFARNNISSLEVFKRLYGFAVTQPWRILDLSGNQLSTPQVFHDLKDFTINQLILRDNEVTKIPSYRERIREILPSIGAIDSVDASYKQDLPVVPPPPPIVELSKVQVLPPNPPKVKFNNGIGNESIMHVDEGVLIRRDPNKRGQDPQWTHLRDSFQSYRNDNMWTQVIVHHGGAFRQREIFNEIVPNLFNTNPFFPCYYKEFIEHDEFFLFKNFDALNNLMKNDLEYPMPHGGKKVTFSLRLNAAPFQEGQVNWINKITLVIQKRLKHSKVLTLDDFSNDAHFSKMIVPMNSKYTLGFILDTARRQSSAIFKISAQNNGISTFECLQSLVHYTQLVTLDLRNNKIETLEGTYSKSLTITDLMLDGNPICERLSCPHDYIAEVRRNFGSLEWLDGCKIDKMLNLAPLQNYFVKRDAYMFAEEFVKTYFPLYDSFERHRLLEMYTDTSVFTLSFHCPYTRNIGQDDIYLRLQKYLRHSRNLSLLSDVSKSIENVMVGKKNIASVFSELSKTNHDMISLCVDVPIYDPTRMIIMKISGVFEEQGQTLNESTLYMGFARTFVLRPVLNNQFVILNDQLFVHKAAAMVKRSQQDQQLLLEQNCADLLPTESEQKKLKLVLFKELTELNEKECVKHLNGSFWDIRVALATFNTLMESGSVKDCDFNFK